MPLRIVGSLLAIGLIGLGSVALITTPLEIPKILMLSSTVTAAACAAAGGLLLLAMAINIVPRVLMVLVGMFLSLPALATIIEPLQLAASQYGIPLVASDTWLLLVAGSLLIAASVLPGTKKTPIVQRDTAILSVREMPANVGLGSAPVVAAGPAPTLASAVAKAPSPPAVDIKPTAIAQAAEPAPTRNAPAPTLAASSLAPTTAQNGSVPVREVVSPGAQASPLPGLSGSADKAPPRQVPLERPAPARPTAGHVLTRRPVTASPSPVGPGNGSKPQGVPLPAQKALAAGHKPAPAVNAGAKVTKAPIPLTPTINKVPAAKKVIPVQLTRKPASKPINVTPTVVRQSAKPQSNAPMTSDASKSIH